MTLKRFSIGVRPAADPQAEAWIRQGDAASNGRGIHKVDVYTARLTVDVTPALRSRIKVVAFTRGITVAEMLRQLLEREFENDIGKDREVAA